MSPFDPSTPFGRVLYQVASPRSMASSVAEVTIDSLISDIYFLSLGRDIVDFAHLLEINLKKIPSLEYSAILQLLESIEAYLDKTKNSLCGQSLDKVIDAYKTIILVTIWLTKDFLENDNALRLILLRIAAMAMFQVQFKASGYATICEEFAQYVGKTFRLEDSEFEDLWFQSACKFIRECYCNTMHISNQTIVKNLLCVGSFFPRDSDDRFQYNRMTREIAFETAFLLVNLEAEYRQENHEKLENSELELTVSTSFFYSILMIAVGTKPLQCNSLLMPEIIQETLSKIVRDTTYTNLSISQTLTISEGIASRYVIEPKCLTSIFKSLFESAAKITITTLIPTSKVTKLPNALGDGARLLREKEMRLSSFRNDLSINDLIRLFHFCGNKNLFVDAKMIWKKSGHALIALFSRGFYINDSFFISLHGRKPDTLNSGEEVADFLLGEFYQAFTKFCLNLELNRGDFLPFLHMTILKEACDALLTLRRGDLPLLKLEDHPSENELTILHNKFLKGPFIKRDLALLIIHLAQEFKKRIVEENLRLPVDDPEEIMQERIRCLNGLMKRLNLG